MDQVIESIVDTSMRVDVHTMSSDTIGATKRHLIDALGCAFGGYWEPPARIARSVASTSRASGASATVLGAGRQFPAELAAFANGVMVRCLDFNDTFGGHGGIGHPSDYMPAVLAAAEEAGCDGRETIAGIVTAYNVFCWLTEETAFGVVGIDHVTNGVIAGAVAAGSVWGLSGEQLGHAVSIATIANIALHQTRIGEVSMWKGSASGNACRNAVFAARLAREGMTGPSDAFLGSSGFFSIVPQPAGAFTSPQIGYDAVTQCHLKRYPSGFFAQSAIEAAYALHRRIDSAERVASVVLGTCAFGKQVMAGDRWKWAPESRESADHSLPFLVASTLMYGSITHSSFSEEALRDPSVERLLGVLTVTVDSACEEAWPSHARSSLTIVLDDGSEESIVVDDYPGHSRNPMPDATINEKFLAQAVPVLGTRAADLFLKRLWSFEEAEDISQALAVTVQTKGRC